ncbi:MAG: sigma 54-interacting transcriptional regulator [Polyangiaceae bacterium]
MSSELPPEDDAATAVRDGRTLDAAARFSLTVREGPDEGARFELDASAPSAFLLGQSLVCSIRLSDPEVSRRHASLDVCDGSGRGRGRVRIRDLGSTNGTFVEGVAVLDAFVDAGEQIRVGGTTLRLERTATDAPPPPRVSGFGRVLGASPEMRRLYPLAQRLARSLLPVVIEGETGTGKEIFAEALHDASDRAAGPYVVFDCTAVPPSLVEAELFGHERGAFTGADVTRKGVFEQAHGGTLLIDEIGDLDLALQPKLLRAIERAEIRRLGASQAVRVNVRVLAATRRDLDREVQAGRFRDDLFHRLAVARLELPPLRERHGDVPLLAQSFWAEFGGPAEVPAELLRRWDEEPWPGNVRELRNAVARHLALGDLALEPRSRRRGGGPVAGAAPPAVTDPIEDVVGEGLPFAMARLKVIEHFERRYVTRMLEEHGGNAKLAAQAAGIGRRYFDMLRVRNRK